MDEHGFCACRKLRLAQAAEANMQYFIDLAEERDQQCKALRAQLAQTQQQPPAPYASVHCLHDSLLFRASHDECGTGLRR